jgi:hypothetical protein
MAARIVEGSWTVGGPSDNDPLVADLGGEVIAVFLQVFLTPDTDPLAIPDGRQLALVVVGIKVPMAWNSRFWSF